MSALDLVGILGALIVLAAFVLNQFAKINREDVFYDAVNGIGSLLLVIYAMKLPSYPFVLLDSVWLAVSLENILEIYIGEKSKLKE